MSKTLLLTSFTTWESGQASNSSDDLLMALSQRNPPRSWHFLRQLPVDFTLAPEKAIAHFDCLQPDAMICCGMSARRTKLSLESRAILRDDVRHTRLNLNRLMMGLKHTEISNDAGQFVCNTLYYSMLKYLQEQNSSSICLFIHVPVLTAANSSVILSEFQIILNRILQSS